jgi:hypothetical protein
MDNKNNWVWWVVGILLVVGLVEKTGIILIAKILYFKWGGYWITFGE